MFAPLLLLPGVVAAATAPPPPPPPPPSVVEPPGFHFWPRSLESQDISGPIGLVDPASNATTWHVFVDCQPGDSPPDPTRASLAWCHLVSDDLVRWRELPLALDRGPPGSPDATGLDTGSLFQLPNGS